MKIITSISMVMMLFTVKVTAQNHQVSYGNDVAAYAQGQYSLFFEQDGVSIYSAFVTINGTITAVSFRVVNTNNYPVIVTWTGPKWFINGSYIDPTSGQTFGAYSQTGYSDKYTANETKDGTYHKIGSNAREVYKYRPNYLYYSAPKGNWGTGALSLQLPNLEILQKF